MGDVHAAMPNRSSEELAMRDKIDAWGRARWPDARVVHELVVTPNRIDMAFIRPTDLIGVEIKSSKDTLDRLEGQMHAFRLHIPEVWVAFAPKWSDHIGYQFNRIEVSDQAVNPTQWVSRDDLTTARMLSLLWAAEARNIAGRMKVSASLRTPLYKLLPELAAHMTGREIVREVCTELRARRAFWRADPPISSTPPAWNQRLDQGLLKLAPTQETKP